MSHNYRELYGSESAEMLEDMDNTVTKLNLWDWLKTYEPEEGKGFMFSDDQNLNLIRDNMTYGGHSGTSFSWTMRNIEFIAKNGWDKFRYQRLARKKFKLTDEYRILNRILNKCASSSEESTHVENLISEKIKKIAEELERNNDLKLLTFAESMRDKLPNGEEQYQSIKKFSEGKMSYAEMRSLCG